MKRAESLVDSKALRTLIALIMTMMAASMMATMVAPRAFGVLERVGFEETNWLNTGRFSGGNCWLDDGSPETQQRNRSNEEITPRGDRDGIKERCQNGRRCHDPTVELTVNLMMEASMALMASMASMVASVELLEWLKRRATEPQGDDAMMMASMAATMVAPEASMVALLASMASMASLDRLRLMTEPKSGAERVDGLSHKICEERADELTIKIDGERVGRLTHIIREERVDGLIKMKIDGERVEKLTRKIREERGDGLTFQTDEERADGWSAKTGEERADGWTYRKVVEQMLVDGDGYESGGCKLAQVTPSTELQECAIPKWEELLIWVEPVATMVVASMASMVAWVASSGGVDGVDGVDGGLVASIAPNGGVDR